LRVSRAAKKPVSRGENVAKDKHLSEIVDIKYESPEPSATVYAHTYRMEKTETDKKMER